MPTQLEREEQYLVDEFNAGRITNSEFNKQMRELQREYQAMANEAAERAYDEEMARW